MSTDSTAPARPEPGAAGTATLPRSAGTAADEASRWADFERRVAQSTIPYVPSPYQWIAPLAVAIVAGLTLHRDVPHPLPAVITAAALLALALALRPEAERIRTGRGPEPDLQELDAYTAWLPRRVPAIPPATLAAAARHTAELAGDRWRSAHLLIARREDGSRAIAQFCQAADRAELILDADIAEGPPEAAIGSLAHEARHSGRLALAVRNLSCLLCLPAWVLIATWALPWPATLTPAAAGQAIGLAAGLRITATLLFWGVEIACDLGAAADHGPAAAEAAFAVIAGADAQLTRSFARRAALRLLNWGATPPHPPLRLRRAAVRVRYGRPAASLPLPASGPAPARAAATRAPSASERGPHE
ncbi:MAG TPA: hypothetical protein VGG25_13460 [Streptosporangiaceae bacterium]